MITSLQRAKSKEPRSTTVMWLTARQLRTLADGRRQLVPHQWRRKLARLVSVFSWVLRVSNAESSLVVEMRLFVL